MDSLPKRKQNRLTGYDYSQPGCYFVTICAKNRRYLFWDEFDWRVGAACGRPRLSQIGTIVEKEIHRLSQIYSMVCVDKFVVMPNHIHLLIRIRFSESGGPHGAAPTTCPRPAPIRRASRDTFPIPSVAARHLPLIRGVGPQGKAFGRPSVPSLRRATDYWGNGGSGKPLPYGFSGSYLGLGRGAPWGSRRQRTRRRWLENLGA